MPILGDLHTVLSAAPETRRIANILNRLVHGSASSFNRQTNVNLDNSYVVIDISELSGDLLTVGMYLSLIHICHHLGDSERSRLHHGLCHAVLSGRHLESVTTRNCNEEMCIRDSHGRGSRSE